MLGIHIIQFHTSKDHVDIVFCQNFKKIFDVIFTGMELSDMDAEHLISNIKASKFADVPIVILTSSEIADIHKRLKGIDFSDFILKENLTVNSLKKCITRFESIDH